MNKLSDNIFFKLSTIFVALLLFYLLLVHIWRSTSPENAPAGLLDHVIRQGPPVEDWIDSRRLNDGND